MTPAQIQAQIANYLDRANDPIISSTIPFMFAIAYADIQRLRNWKFQETSAFEVFANDPTFPTPTGLDNYCAPVDIKEPFSTYSWDPVTQRMIEFYHQVDIQTLRDARRHNWPWIEMDINDPINSQFQRHRFTHLFAIWAEKIEIHPRPGQSLIGKQLRMDYYRYVPVPAPDCSDWLTLNHFDFLLYRSLVEAVPFLDSTDNRLQIWGAQREKAQKDILGLDVSASWATDSMVMRG